VVRHLLGNIGLCPMTAAPTPRDQADLGGERDAQRHRLRLALASLPPHNFAMTTDLTEDDKAALIELLRETIASDRFPLSPRIKRLRAVLAKFDPPSPRPEPLPPPKPPGEPSQAVRRKKRR